MAVTMISDKIMHKKVKITTSSSFAAISLVRFIGYMNNTLIDLVRYSSITNREISTDAKTIKVALTKESTRPNIVT